VSEIFVVQVEAAPDNVTNSDYEFGGAYINVYTTELDICKAIAIAEKEVIDAGWCVTRTVSAILNAEDDFQDEDSGLSYYRQALLDGVVVVVHTYPPEHVATGSLQ